MFVHEKRFLFPALVLICVAANTKLTHSTCFSYLARHDQAPLMKQLYTVYITRHPLALSRFAILTAPLPSSRSNSLGTSSSSTPSKKPSEKLSSSVIGAPSGYTTANNAKVVDMPSAMRKYLANARVLTERHTNAWDLPSLLIKVRSSTRRSVHSSHLLT